MKDDRKIVLCCAVLDGRRLRDSSNAQRAHGWAGLAISLADSMGIPVFNLRKAGALDRVARFLEGVGDLGAEGQKQNP